MIRILRRLSFLSLFALFVAAPTVMPAEAAPAVVRQKEDDQKLPKASVPPAEKPAQPAGSEEAVYKPRVDGMKPSEAKNFSDWTMRCFPIQSATPCDVFQMVVKKDTKQRVLNVSIAYAPRANAYIAQFVVPWGVALQKGLTVEAGRYSAKGLPFRRCSLSGCYVEGRLDSAMVNAFANSQKAMLKIESYEGKPISLPLSLNGIAPALAAMKSAAAQKLP